MSNIQTEIQNNYKRYRFDDSHKELKEEIINKILDNDLTLEEFYDLMLHIIGPHWGQTPLKFYKKLKIFCTYISSMI